MKFISIWIGNPNPCLRRFRFVAGVCFDICFVVALYKSHFGANTWSMFVNDILLIFGNICQPSVVWHSVA